MKSLSLFTFLTVTALLAVAAFAADAPLTPTLNAQNCIVPLKRFSILRQPKREVGHYCYSEIDIQNYYLNQPQTAGVISLNDPDTSSLYQINSQGEYQILNWQTAYPHLFARQERWQFNMPGFIAAAGATSLNEAQKNIFKTQKFDMKSFKYVKPYRYMMEWGDLNHPTLSKLPENGVAMVSPQLAKPANLNSVYFSPEFHEKVDTSSDSELSSGNQFRVLADSDSFEAKLKEINDAKSTLWVSTLVFVNDGSAKQIADALIRRAQQGLDVRVIVERSLALYHRQLPALMRRNGVKVIYANDYFKYNSTSIYHSKTLIADGARGIMGGQNMIDADLGSNGTDFKNRDVDVLVTGPVVTDMALRFMQDWNHFVATKSIISNNSKQEPFNEADMILTTARMQRQRDLGLRGREHYATWLSDPNQRMKGLARFVHQAPYHNISTITEAHLAYMNEVQDYFALTDPQALDTLNVNSPASGKKSTTNFNRLFQKFAEILNGHPNLHLDFITSGVDFGINEAVPMTEARMTNLINGRHFLLANMNLAFMNSANLYMSKAHFANLFNDWVPRANVDVWLHVSFMHSKIWYFDRTAVSLGSFNFHDNATDHAYESTMIIQDEDFNKEIESTIALDMANSVPLLRQEKTP